MGSWAREEGGSAGTGGRAGGAGSRSLQVIFPASCCWAARALAEGRGSSGAPMGHPGWFVGDPTGRLGMKCRVPCARRTSDKLSNFVGTACPAHRLRRTCTKSVFAVCWNSDCTRCPVFSFVKPWARGAVGKKPDAEGQTPNDSTSRKCPGRQICQERSRRVVAKHRGQEGGGCLMEKFRQQMAIRATPH